MVASNFRAGNSLYPAGLLPLPIKMDDDMKTPKHISDLPEQVNAPPLIITAPDNIVPRETSAADSMVAVIERIALDPNSDIEKLERMLAMKERLDSKAAEIEFNVAMSRVQAEIKPIIANAKGQNNRYATYAQIDEAIRPIYTRHGFSLSFNTGENAVESEINVLCYVSHVAGFSRTYHVDMPADGKGAQGGSVMTKTHAAGSAMSYGMRYLLGLIFNLAIIKDDDGVAAALTQQTITEEQQATIQDMIDASHLDMAQFMKKCKVQNLSEIHTGAYNGAVNLIRQAAKRREDDE